MLARNVGLAGERGTFEVAPDGRSYADRESAISRFDVAGHALHDVHALISSHLTGYSALCGYDFFMRFPTLIDREHSAVTLFPAPSKIARMHCLPVNLAPRVPLARVEINGAWRSQIVLDSGMAGGGALWDGVRRAANPLVSTPATDDQPALPAASRAVGRQIYGSRPARRQARYRCAPSRSGPTATTESSKRIFRRPRHGGGLPASADLLRRRRLFAGVGSFQQPPPAIGNPSTALRMTSSSSGR